MSRDVIVSRWTATCDRCGRREHYRFRVDDIGQTDEELDAVEVEHVEKEMKSEGWKISRHSAAGETIHECPACH